MSTFWLVYIFGGISIVVLTLADNWRETWGRLKREKKPSGAVGIILGAAIGTSLVASAWPFLIIYSLVNLARKSR